MSRLDWEAHGMRAYADSEAWFPDVHNRGLHSLLVHFTLGLIGEVGELDDALFAKDRSHADWHAEVANELADCATYCSQLAIVVDCDLDAAIPHRARERGHARPVVMLLGDLANAVKKLHRYDRVETQTAAAIEQAQYAIVRTALIGLAWRTLEIGRNANVDVDAAIEDKRGFNIKRWGQPQHRSTCNCFECGTVRALAARARP